jgi:hypothetical protein
MIKVAKLESTYWACNSCLSKNEVLNITIGAESSHTSSIRLCKKCSKELIEKLGVEQ